MGNDETAAEEGPSPRLCHLRKWPDFEGYGFNLQYEKHTSTEFIGDVDGDSPAECTGMRKGDRVIEVNGDNIEGLPHPEVIEKIKANPNETRLLVVDTSTYDFYNDRGIQITSTMRNVEHHETPPVQPRPNGPEAPTQVGVIKCYLIVFLVMLNSDNPVFL